MRFGQLICNLHLCLYIGLCICNFLSKHIYTVRSDMYLGRIQKIRTTIKARSRIPA